MKSKALSGMTRRIRKYRTQRTLRGKWRGNWREH